MANTPMTRYGESAQKKTHSVAAVTVDSDFYGEADYTPAAGTTNYHILNLPEDAVLTDAYVVVDEGLNAATSATVKLGTAEGGAQIMVATDVKTVGSTGKLVSKLRTGTGMPVYLGLAITGAVSAPGSFTVVVEYTEYKKNTGEYTRF